MDKYIAEGIENNEGNWELRKDTELGKVWTRWEGTEFSPDFPVIRCEHYLAGVKDIDLVMRCINDADKRNQWDFYFKDFYLKDVGLEYFDLKILS